MSGREYAKRCACMSRALDLCVNTWAEQRVCKELSRALVLFVDEGDREYART